MKNSGGKVMKKFVKILDNLKKHILKAEAILQSKEVKKNLPNLKRCQNGVSMKDIDPGTLPFITGHLSKYNVGSLQVVYNVVDIRIVKQFNFIFI